MNNRLELSSTNDIGSDNYNSSVSEEDHQSNESGVSETDNKLDNSEETDKIDQNEIREAVIAQKQLYSSLLEQRIRLQKKIQYLNDDEAVKLIPKIEVENRLQNYIESAGLSTSSSLDKLDALYDTLLNESQQETKLKGMQPISEQLQQILLKDESRLLKKTQLNRLTKVEDESVFDESDFYAMMLKEYLEQKSNSPENQAKIKKFKQSIKVHTREVDRKGTKARKLNTEKIHEKIRGLVPTVKHYKGLWEFENIDMLVNGLFGQSGIANDEDVGEFNVF
eukprot:NODE_71_length_24927_cov_1.205937.p13 type:complete len:280 gc:universal NODE_71_length_24927_cov_1.205937:12953-13792(+)